MHFLFRGGSWQGSGEITIPLSDTPLPLTVRWTVEALDDGRFRAIQQVTVTDHEPMINSFVISNVVAGDFQIFLENESIGMFGGTGVQDKNRLAWEFSHKGALEGYEVYEQKNEREYAFRAEYLGGDGFATVVSGSIREDS